jgi:hypothetical protein
MVSILLLLLAVPLVLLHGQGLLFRADCLCALLGLLVGIVTVWTILRRRCDDPEPSVDSTVQDQEEKGPPLWTFSLIAALLGVLTFVSFYRPLRIHFWAGVDECVNFEERPLLEGARGWNASKNRPLTVLSWVVAKTLTPNRIEGFLWLGAGLCWASGVLLLALLREVLPQARLLGVVAAVLLIIDRSESTRYFVLWTGNYYWTTLVLLLAGAWLFLRSYRLGSRPLLVLSCLLLGGSLLTNEGPYPLALLIPLLAWFRRDHRHRLPVWSFAWIGTLALLATRFLLFLHTGSERYQADQLSGALHDPSVVLRNLTIQLKAGLSYFDTSGAALVYWKATTGILALAVALVGLAAWGGRGETATRRRHYLLGLCVATLAFLLGLVPFIHLPTLLRTQFIAAPGRAVVLACLVCLGSSWLGHRAGGTILAGCVGLLAANASAEALLGQQKARASSQVSFERTVDIYRQIHALSPRLAPDTLLLLVSDDPKRPPLNMNYCCLLVSRQLLGASMVQVGFDDAQVGPVFERDSIRVNNGHLVDHVGKVGYDKVLAFRVADDSPLQLLHRLPDHLLPSGHSASRYNPLARLEPGAVGELPYLRYPRWAERPQRLDLGDGIVLGSGWGSPHWEKGKLSRWVAHQAELIVNPLGQRNRTLHLDVEEEQIGRLFALDKQGKVLASADLAGQKEIALTVPTDPARVNLIRLRTSAGEPFRVYCPSSKAPRVPQQPQEVIAAPLVVGNNWYPLEHWQGETFRWVANDAELVLDILPGGGHLLLKVEPGFGLGQQSMQLTLRDQGEEVLAAASIRGRQEVRLNLPACSRPGDIVRLHVDGGVQPTANDPRTLNFRVFSCCWEKD